ncbi:MAG: GGDEF domain-containing protein [Candidatus Latescibacteria bacterium]|jgi:diguanylate cyclase (GGDEF)-like protein/PAS domain S-box-containing protein|nr:GGDEF domain-containing protein [Candidatus Latescibacterota bacterium]
MDYEKSFYKNLLDTMSDGVYIVNTKRRIKYWNNGAEDISGYKASEVVGSSCFDNILAHVDDEGRELCVEGCPLFDTIRDGEKREINAYLHHKDGHRVPVSISTSPIISHGGKIIGALEVFRDISNIINQETVENLKKAAFIDPLTGLANRKYIEMKLNSSFVEKTRYNIPFGVIRADIDKFKEINDTHGQNIGNEVLKMVAKTLEKNIRMNDIFGYWGDGEFVGVITHIPKEQLISLAYKLGMLIEQSYFRKNGTHIKVTVTIGVDDAKEDDTNESIIKRANNLLSEGKSCGRNYVMFEKNKNDDKKKERKLIKKKE